ncbi:MAG TPA: hypothetical protein PKI19_01200 [Elusimicrobiales bacterium]|nr:hypothetical protein [Elusimicrobiales bacterium]
MPRFLLLCASLFLLPAFSPAQLSSRDGAEPLELSGYISSWTQDCGGGRCSLPRPGVVNRPVRLRLGLPSAPGEASAAAASEKDLLETGGELSAEISFYAVCPYVGRGGAAQPGAGTCAGRYFQAQVTLSGTAEAFCSAALNDADFSPWPVLMCAGAAGPGLRAGVTLHRRPF